MRRHGDPAGRAEQVPAGKGAEAADQKGYREAWAFFGRKRLMERAPKIQRRVKNEREHAFGFDESVSRSGGKSYRKIVPTLGIY